MFDDFATLAREREVADTAILDWAGQLTPAWLCRARSSIARRPTASCAQLPGVDRRDASVPARGAPSRTGDDAAEAGGQGPRRHRSAVPAGRDPRFGVRYVTFDPNAAYLTPFSDSERRHPQCCGSSCRTATRSSRPRCWRGSTAYRPRRSLRTRSSSRARRYAAKSSSRSPIAPASAPTWSSRSWRSGCGRRSARWWPWRKRRRSRRRSSRGGSTRSSATRRSLPRMRRWRATWRRPTSGCAMTSPRVPRP